MAIDLGSLPFDRIWRKSGLQERLEAEGWEFFSNCTSGDSSFLPQLYETYKEVRFADAYDSKASPLRNMQAVYVREKKGK